MKSNHSVSYYFLLDGQNASPDEIITMFSLFIFLLSYLIFPFYNHIFKKNQKRDEATAVFQIINHFHDMICRLYYVMAMYFFLTPFHILYQVDWVHFVSFFYASVSIVALVIVTEVNHFLLSLLAIQRFLLYFVPSSDKYLNISGRTMKWVLRFSYGLITFLLVYLFYLNVKQEHNPTLKSKLPIRHFLTGYIVENVFLLASTLLYLPIMISIKKLGHLASAQLNKPQRYVLWQLVAVFIGKMVLIPLFVFQNQVTVPNILCLVAIDGYYTAIIIQLTYLGCNRHNLKSLLSSLKPRNFCRVMFCPCRLKEQVEPGVYQIESTGRN